MEKSDSHKFALAVVVLLSLTQVSSIKQNPLSTSEQEQPNEQSNLEIQEVQKPLQIQESSTAVYIQQQEEDDFMCAVQEHREKLRTQQIPISSRGSTLKERPEREKEYLDIPLEQEYQDLVVELEEILKVPKHIIYGTMEIESHFDNSVVSYAGARGIMQLMPKSYTYMGSLMKETHPELYSRLQGIDDIKSNIIVGVYELHYLQNKSKGKGVHYILTAYNHGATGAERFYKKYETYESKYSHAVVKASKNYLE